MSSLNEERDKAASIMKMGKCEASTKAIKLTLGSHSQTKDDTEMFAWSNRWGKSAYTTGSNRLINEQLDIQQVKSKGHSS